jgi:hypothetical protein
MDSLFDDAELHGALAARAPSTDRPYWRTPSGERTSFPALRASLPDDQREALDDAHAQAILHIARAAIRAQASGGAAEARRLAQAASRLCQETVGLWASPSLLTEG